MPLIAMTGQTIDLMTVTPESVNALVIHNTSPEPVILFLALEGVIIRGDKLFTKLRYTFDDDGHDPAPRSAGKRGRVAREPRLRAGGVTNTGHHRSSSVTFSTRQ